MNKKLEIIKNIAMATFLLAVLMKIFIPDGPIKLFLGVAILLILTVIFTNIARLKLSK